MARSKKIHKDLLDGLQTKAKGNKDGLDWRNGMAAAGKSGKRSWQQFENHFNETLRKFLPIGTMDKAVQATQQACKFNLSHKNLD